MISIILTSLTIGINLPFMLSVSLFRPRTCLSCEIFGIQSTPSLQSETQWIRGRLLLVLLELRRQGKREVCRRLQGCTIAWRDVAREFPLVWRISFEQITAFNDRSVWVDSYEFIIWFALYWIPFRCPWLCHRNCVIHMPLHIYPVTHNNIYWKYENTRHRPNLFVLFELAVRIETIEFILIQSQHWSYRHLPWGWMNRRTKCLLIFEVIGWNETTSKNLGRLFGRCRVTDGWLPTLYCVIDG